MEVRQSTCSVSAYADVLEVEREAAWCDERRRARSILDALLDASMSVHSLLGAFGRVESAPVRHETAEGTSGSIRAGD